jgi:hypothetical protein
VRAFAYVYGFVLELLSSYSSIAELDTTQAESNMATQTAKMYRMQTQLNTALVNAELMQAELYRVKEMHVAKLAETQTAHSADYNAFLHELSTQLGTMQANFQTQLAEAEVAYKSQLQREKQTLFTTQLELEKMHLLHPPQAQAQFDQPQAQPELDPPQMSRIIAGSREGNVDLTSQANIRRWKDRALGVLCLEFPRQDVLEIAVRALALAIDDKPMTEQELRIELCTRSKDELTRILPTNFVKNEVIDGQKRYVKWLKETRFTPARCVNIQYGLMLSLKKMERLQRILFMDFSSEGKWEPATFEGIQVPRLASRLMRERYVAEITGKFQLKSTDGGLSTTVHLRTLVKDNIQLSITNKLMYIDINTGFVKSDCFHEDPDLMKYTDMANQFKGMRVCASACQLPHGCRYPNSPMETFEYALHEGKDSLEDLQSLGYSGLEYENDLIRNPLVDLGLRYYIEEGKAVVFKKEEEQELFPDGKQTYEVQCRVNFKAGGDQAHINSMQCLAGCNCTHPCPYCEVSRDDMCVTELAAIKKNTERTLERIMLLSHSIEGKCPGCLYDIVARKTGKNPKKQMLVANYGDPEPEVPLEIKEKYHGTGKTLSWTQLHKGVRYGSSPPYLWAPKDWISCLLHCGLCITKGLWERTIVAEIGKLGDSKRVTEGILQSLQVMGIHMKPSKLKPKSKKLSDYDDRLKNSGFGGGDTYKILNGRDNFLRLVCPEDICGKWIDDAILFATPESFKTHLQAAARGTGRKYSIQAAMSKLHIRRAWYLWSQLWNLLNIDMNYLPGTSHRVVWNIRADEVQSLAVEFVKSWVKAAKATQGLYLHLLVAHIPDQIRWFGDLRVRQTQGLEHSHKIRKAVGRNATNRKPGQRLCTMLKHNLVNGSVNKGRSAFELSAEMEKVQKAKKRRFLSKTAYLEAMQLGGKASTHEERMQILSMVPHAKTPKAITDKTASRPSCSKELTSN